MQVRSQTLPLLAFLFLIPALMTLNPPLVLFTMVFLDAACTFCLRFAHSSVGKEFQSSI
jgi:hypothetical protein